MGLQQCPNQRWGPMEGSNQNEQGIIQTNCHFFRMCNSLAIFQSMMDAIFWDLTDACLVIIYMDNIFLFARDPKTLEENTKK